MDEFLRRTFRDLNNADPIQFLAAARLLERTGAEADAFSDLLERVLNYYDAFYTRGRQEHRNTFEIAWSLKEQYRRCLKITLLAGGNFWMARNEDRRPELYATLSDNKFSHLLELIIRHRRLSAPTPQFLRVLKEAIVQNGVISCEELPVLGTNRWLFDVMARINPDKDWQPQYHLRFEFVRSACRDLLQVSIEDNLYWGTEHEVQGMRITGTSYTVYDGVDPNDDEDGPPEDPLQPYSTYEIISHIDELPAIVAEIFNRFRQI